MKTPWKRIRCAVRAVCTPLMRSDNSSNATRLCFYQTRLAWSVDQGSNKNHSPAYNFAPTVTKFCVMWEGLSLPHDTKCGNCRCKIVDSRAFPSWSLIHGLRWSGLIKAEPARHERSMTTQSIAGQNSMGARWHAVGAPRKRHCRRGRAVTSPCYGKYEIIRYIF